MKKFLLLLCMICVAVCADAAKLTSGSLDCLKGEVYMAVRLDCSKAKYKNTRSFQEFLNKARRNIDWESASMSYFYEHFNAKSYKFGITAVPPTSTHKGKYELVLVPLNIKGNGGIEGVANLVNTETGQIMAEMDFSTDGDNDDRITFRDPMKEAGDQFAKLFNKSIK